MNRLVVLFFIFLSMISCKTSISTQNPSGNRMGMIDTKTVQVTVDSIKKHHPKSVETDIRRGVEQASKFWMETDGSNEEFIRFCTDHYLGSDSDRMAVLEKISRNMEILNGYFNKISLSLKEPLHLDIGEITPVDQIFGGYEPASHLSDDLFKNKIAFIVLLNYRFYSLPEKTQMGTSWTRMQWAMARLGELSKSRVPGDLLLNYGDVVTKADTYISEYNIFMGKLLNDNKEKLFPADMKLISHWGLRDELKANYNTDRGLEKQKMIYAVMNHIIEQDIPAQVINSEKVEWNPLKNVLYSDGKVIARTSEPDTRYQWLLNNFQALKAMDPYNPFFPTYIQVQFDSNMEIPQPDVEKLFIDLVSSPEVKKVAKLIETRLGRGLQPFDIWYDGFKARSSVNTSELDKTIRKMYPDAAAFEKDIPHILVKLGFAPDKASYIASKIQVDDARGSGHAWGAQMKGDKAHLRTRVGKDGMDYKGFNVAMHELGHCVEQTLTLYDIDHYLLNGVPNTAFTEALAFVFQKRDLEVLNIRDNNPLKQDLMALDIFWSNYEIMGVSLVDMNVWKWLYENPGADKKQLKEAVIRIAKEVWNNYYAGIFGVKDQPILAIYSHMIDYPLYLSAYPIGHLIDFQIEKSLEGKNFGDAVMKMYSKGRIVPQVWMEENFGAPLSDKPLLEAVDHALERVK